MSNVQFLREIFNSYCSYGLIAISDPTAIPTKSKLSLDRFDTTFTPSFKTHIMFCSIDYQKLIIKKHNILIFDSFRFSKLCRDAKLMVGAGGGLEVQDIDLIFLKAKTTGASDEPPEVKSL